MNKSAENEKAQAIEGTTAQAHSVNTKQEKDTPAGEGSRDREFIARFLEGDFEGCKKVCIVDEQRRMIDIVTDPDIQAPDIKAIRAVLRFEEWNGSEYVPASVEVPGYANIGQISFGYVIEIKDYGYPKDGE